MEEEPKDEIVVDDQLTVVLQFHMVASNFHETPVVALL